MHLRTGYACKDESMKKIAKNNVEITSLTVSIEIFKKKTRSIIHETM